MKYDYKTRKDRMGKNGVGVDLLYIFANILIGVGTTIVLFEFFVLA